jgi:hypothetical protein
VSSSVCSLASKCLLTSCGGITLIHLQCPEYNVRNVPEQEHAGKISEGCTEIFRNNEEVMEVVCVCKKYISSYTGVHEANSL